ncbi:MAG: outer membrane lipoprotein chaperone LolA [Candidatus Lambdaproteobacteria bacterium]|nr:outer membrane lipoprotein chaperone LolA [Candidatus Lambdaproteobacteria bacterium]
MVAESLLVLALVAPALVPAQEAGCDTALLARVQSAYQAIGSFQGRFDQLDRRIDGTVAEGKGQIAYRKPGRMRWAYEPPQEQLLVTDGATVWLYDPVLENVTIQPLADLTRGTPLAFLLGAGNLAADFTCRALSRPPADPALATLELVPRQPIPALEYIQLGVQPDTARIAAFSMVDTQGNVREVRLQGLRFGAPLAPDLFTFVVAPGMEVIQK